MRKIRFIIALLLFPLLLVQAQSVENLNKEQTRIKEEIGMLTNLINQTSSSFLSQQEKYNLLIQRRDARRNLITSLNAEIRYIDNQVEKKQASIDAIKEEVEKVKDEYAQLARQMYLWKKTSSPYVYVLSSQSMNQAVRRYFYIKQFEQNRKDKQVYMQELITQEEEEKTALELTRQEKQKVSQAKQVENENLQADINAMQVMLNELQGKQEELKANLAQQKKAMEALEKTIADLIARETKKEKAKPAGLDATPEAKALAQAFEANKGKLPWPVKKGVIGMGFGKQAHPTLKNLTIDNNGVDITTEKNAEVAAIFRGTVVNVVYVPGYQKMAIIKHGNYYSVYSHLDDVYVKKDMEVETGSVIGTAFYDNQARKSQVHLEIWKGRDKLNPTQWLLKGK